MREILIPGPGYPLLSYLASFEGLRCFSYPLRYDKRSGWFIDIDILQALITKNTKAITIVNPNNPTGSFVKKKELENIDAICRKHNIAIIIDEVFSDFASTDNPDMVITSIHKTESLTFVLNGLSKTAGLPQMKMSWIVACGNSTLAKDAKSRLETMLDFYLSVSTPVQIAAGNLLKGRRLFQKQIISRIGSNSKFLENQTAKTSNCRLLIREGGWYSILRINDDLTDEERVLQLLEWDNVLVHPGYFYEFDREGFIVVSLITPVEIFQTGILKLIKRFCC